MSFTAKTPMKLVSGIRKIIVEIVKGAMYNKGEKLSTIRGSEVTTKENTGHSFKSFFFADLFNDEKRALELFNLLENENLPDSTKVVLCDEEMSKILALRNDVAFIIEDRFIIVTEHQSTLSRNMPLRILRYFADILFAVALDKGSIYRKTLIKLPIPKFYVVYNGKDTPRDSVLKLSDAYVDKSKAFDLEVRARIVDIEYERFCRCAETSGSHPEQYSNVYGYSFLVHEIHKNLDKGIRRDQAIKRAVEKCIEEGILTEYIKNKGLEELLAMLSYEYNHADEIAYRAEESKEEGRQEGKAEVLSEIVPRLINLGLSVEDIAKATGLTIHETAARYEVQLKNNENKK